MTIVLACHAREFMPIATPTGEVFKSREAALFRTWSAWPGAELPGGRSHDHPGPIPCLRGFDPRIKETHAGPTGVKAYVLQFASMAISALDIALREAMLDGKVRHFAASPVRIDRTSEAWTRAVAWDEGEAA